MNIVSVSLRVFSIREIDHPLTVFYKPMILNTMGNHIISPLNFFQLTFLEFLMSNLYYSLFLFVRVQIRY